MHKSGLIKLIVFIMGAGLLMHVYSREPQPIGANSQNSDPRTPSATSTLFPGTSQLAIISYHSATADLYTFDTDNLALHLIAKNVAATYPAWSPDHKYLAFAQKNPAGDIQIEIMNVSSLERYPVYTFSHRILSGFDPPVSQIRWSQDGRLLAFDITLDSGQGERSYVYILDIKGVVVNVYGPSDLHIYVEKWLPSSKEFAYLLHNGTCNSIYIQGIYKEPWDNRFLIGCSNADELSTPSATRPYCLLDSGNLLATAWSSDAHYLAATLELASPPCPDIILIDPTTAHVTLLPFVASELAFAPDNKSIAYIEDKEPGRVCIVDISGANNRCGPVLGDNLWEFKWQTADGIEEVVTSIDNDNSQICLIAVDTFSKRCLTDPLPGFASIVD